MADYNLVQMEDLYFTTDGTGTGVPCRIETDGVDGLALDYTGAVALSGNGTPYAFVLENVGAGVFLKIKPLVIYDTVFEAIKDIINTSIGSESEINLVITGATGTWDLNCIPNFPKPIEFPGKTQNGRIFESSINLVVVSVN